MVIRLLTTILVLLLGIPTAGALPRTAATMDDGDRYLTAATERLQADGAAWAVISRGQITHAGVTGNDGNGSPTRPETPFFFGSVSKPMLANLVVDLAQRGTVKLETPVAQQLPALRAIPGAGAITARHLLEHRSGLPFGAEYLDLDDPNRTPKGVVEQLQDVRLASQPGKEYRYSSLGYLVLTAWLEASTGRAMKDLMHGAGINAAPVPAGRRGPWLPAMTTNLDPAGLGYGYTSGSITTLAQFARDSLQRTDHTGWRTDPLPDGTARTWHTGMVPGYFTAVYLLPDQQTAVVFAINRSGTLDENRLYDASVGLLDIARGKPVSPISGWPSEFMIIAGVLIMVAALGIWLGRRRRKVLRLIGLTIGVLLVAGPILTTAAMGMPLRFGVLYAPELMGAFVATGAITILAALLTWRGAERPRQQVQESGHERQHPADHHHPDDQPKHHLSNAVPAQSHP